MPCCPGPSIGSKPLVAVCVLSWRRRLPLTAKDLLHLLQVKATEKSSARKKPVLQENPERTSFLRVCSHMNLVHNDMMRRDGRPDET